MNARNALCAGGRPAGDARNSPGQYLRELSTRGRTGVHQSSVVSFMYDKHKRAVKMCLSSEKGRPDLDRGKNYLPTPAWRKTVPLMRGYVYGRVGSIIGKIALESRKMVHGRRVVAFCLASLFSQTLMQTKWVWVEDPNKPRKNRSPQQHRQREVAYDGDSSKCAELRVHKLN